MRMVIENLALHDQIGQLEIYCDYGVTADGKQDIDGCPQVIHLADRKGHMEICEYCSVDVGITIKVVQKLKKKKLYKE